MNFSTHNDSKLPYKPSVKFPVVNHSIYIVYKKIISFLHFKIYLDVDVTSIKYKKI